MQTLMVPKGTRDEVPRDDAILAALAAGPLSIAALVAATGMGQRRCERGLRRLQDAGYVFRAAPMYRLTAAGRAVLPEPPATAPEPAARQGRRATKPVRSVDRTLDLTL